MHLLHWSAGTVSELITGFQHVHIINSWLCANFEARVQARHHSCLWVPVRSTPLTQQQRNRTRIAGIQGDGADKQRIRCPAGTTSLEIQQMFCRVCHPVMCCGDVKGVAGQE